VAIRAVEQSDAEGMIKLFSKLDSETSFIMMEPGERKVTPDDQVKRIEEYRNSSGKYMAVAVERDEVVGFIVASCGTANRNRHSTYLVIGIAKAYRGQGIGTNLINAME